MTRLPHLPGSTEIDMAALDLSRVQIPDLWHIALAVKDDELDPDRAEQAGDLILEVWHLAHDLLKAARAS